MQYQGIKSVEALKPSWYDNMELKSTDHQYEYHWHTYCGLDIYENLERTHFNALRIMEQVMLKDDDTNESDSRIASTRMKNLMTGKFWTHMKEDHPEWFFSRGGEGARKYRFGGLYMQWHLFNAFIEAAHTGSTMYLDCGMEIPLDKSGYLYWCKPEKNKACLGTDTIKVGRTWSWNQRKNVGYGKKTIEYRIIRTNDMYNYEALMLKAVGQILTHDTNKGDEYYILKDDDEEKWDKMKDIFDNLEDIYTYENIVKRTQQSVDSIDEDDVEKREAFLPTLHLFEEGIEEAKKELENMH